MNRAGLAVALALATAVGVIFAVWPQLDIALAAPFYDPQRHFWRTYDPFYQRLSSVTMWIVALVAAPAMLSLLAKFVYPDRQPFIRGRAVFLTLVTLALIPGILANLVLKEHWSRPRPLGIVEFGGPEHFRPWWDPRGECPYNCSFVSGEGSAAFWTLAPAAVTPPQWRAVAYAAALAFGCAVSILRMAAGAHFFTDVFFAGFFAFVVIWLLHGWLYRWRATRISDVQLERVVGRMRPKRA
ncbi:MAG: phosphatase PAP2 family protein [Xanthobacteraceae bacterium]|jgi:lipid A 4'-phosphatase